MIKKKDAGIPPAVVISPRASSGLTRNTAKKQSAKGTAMLFAREIITAGTYLIRTGEKNSWHARKRNAVPE